MRAAWRLAAILLSIAASGTGSGSQAAAPQGKEMTVPTRERQVAVTLFHAKGDRPHPAVLMLHGAGGFRRRLPDYEQYADTLAQNGFDTYLVNYYSKQDTDAMSAGQNVFVARFTNWAYLVDDVADWAIKQCGANGHVALVGFSNGGILAVGAGSIDKHVDAAVVYYGAVPSALNVEIERVPPLLILHGDADQIIPVEAAKELAAAARQLGATADLVIYPGESHGFGTRPKNKDAADALKRTLAFLKQKLAP